MTRLIIFGWCLCLVLFAIPATYADELPAVTEEGQQAMAAVDQIWAHLAEGEVEKALAGHLQPEDPHLLEKLTETLKVQGEVLESGMIQIHSVYARIEGDWALVPIQVTMKRGEEVSRSVGECWAYRQPGKEGDKEENAGTWKIVSEAVMRDERIKPLMADDVNNLQEWWHEHVEQLQKLKPKEEPGEADEG